MLAGLERRPRQLEVRVARRADVDDIDVVAANQLAGLGCDDRDRELVGGLLRAFDDRVGDRHDPAARIADEPGRCARGPGAGAEHADTHGW